MNKKEIKMGFEKDFEHVWKPMANGIKAALLKERKEKNEVSVENAVNALMREKREWSDPLRVQYSFIISMQDKAPESARMFQEALERFQFAEVPMTPLPGKMPYMAGALLAAAAGGFAGSLLPESFFLMTLIGRIPVILLGAVVFGGIGIGLSRTLWQAKAEESRKDCAEPYMEQLQALHNQLLEICRMADRS